MHRGCYKNKNRYSSFLLYSIPSNLIRLCDLKQIFVCAIANRQQLHPFFIKVRSSHSARRAVGIISGNPEQAREFFLTLKLSRWKKGHSRDRFTRIASMTIPDFQSIMLPLMQFADDEKEHSSKESIEYLANYFNLTDEERKEPLPSGKQPIFSNRIGWAKSHLNRARLLESPRRSIFKITARGMKVLAQEPAMLNMKVLKQFPEYLEFIGSVNNQEKSVAPTEDDPISQDTPEEIVEYGYQKIRQALAQDILAKVKSFSPSFFEQLVVELLVKMGYGGSIKEAGRAIGKTNDEGIDGIIKEDRLGLDAIYIQAKRWNDTVGRPEIQRFVGALAGQGAKKGIFITTSKFSEQAKDYTPRNETKIVLIDGEELAQYMIDFNLGVSIVSEYQIKKIDSDYFGDE